VTASYRSNTWIELIVRPRACLRVRVCVCVHACRPERPCRHCSLQGGDHQTEAGQGQEGSFGEEEQSLPEGLLQGREGRLHVPDRLNTPTKSGRRDQMNFHKTLEGREGRMKEEEASLYFSGRPCFLSVLGRESESPGSDDGVRGGKRRRFFEETE